MINAMEQAGTGEFDVKKMMADYMENGCLENIIDMFKHDETLYSFVGDLLTDERMRVRIGAIALLEELKKEEPAKTKRSLPSILPLLNDQNPVARGDAAYLLGIIGDESVIPHLLVTLNDEDPNVRLIAKEAIDDIRNASHPLQTTG